MEVISINQLRVMLGDLAMNHKFVNDFFWGDIDSMRAWKGRIAQYPLVTAYSTAVQVNKTTKLITFNLEVSDKLYSDYERNINEIESDTEQTIQDLFDGMRNFAQWKKVGVVQNDSFSATKFINQTGDTVAGWRASITLKLIKNQGLCLAPFEGFTPTPPIVCEPATVTNSNDTFFQSVLSGGSYVLPDNMVTDSDGTVMLIPAQTPFVCTPQITPPDSPISIAGTYISDLPSGDSLNIVTTDQNDVPIVPISGTVSGGVATVKVNIPVCPAGGGIVGEIFSHDFTSGIFPSEMTNNLTSSTFTSDGLKVNSGSVSYPFPQNITLNNVNGSNDWRMKAVIKIDSVSGASYGLAIGSGSVNSFTYESGSIVHLLLTSGAGIDGKLRLYGKESAAGLVDSIGSLVFSTNDEIELTVTREQNVVRATAFNLTTKTSFVSFEYTFDLSITTPDQLLDNTGKFKVYSFSGNFTIKSLIVENLGFIGGTVFIGDSITSGYLTKNNITSYVSVVSALRMNRFGGQADTTNEVLLYLPQIINQNKPKYAVIMIGVNDFQFGVTVSVYESNLNTIVSTLASAGVIVKLITPTPMTSGIFGYVNKSINVATANSIPIIDAYTLLGDGLGSLATIYNGDTIHPNALGHKILGDKIREVFPDIL